MSIYATRRRARSARKTMLRFFTDRGFAGFAADVRDIAKDSARSGVKKHALFQKVLDRYVVFVTRQKAESAAKTSPDATPGDVVVHGA